MINQNQLTSLRSALTHAHTERDAALRAVENLPANAADKDAIPVIDVFDRAQSEVDRIRANIDHAEMIQRAHEASPPIRTFATARGGLQTESTYRPDTIGERSFFSDLFARGQGDGEARARLESSNAEHRDMANASTTGGDFLPQLYLADLWVSPSIANRPFADALPKMDLPPTGTTIAIPHLSSGVSVAARSDGGAVSETDGVTANIEHFVNEISGQVDIGRIALTRSAPGLDAVIGETLVRRYNAYLDTQCLSGSGTAPQHLGIRGVSGVNTVAYTDASPTAAEIYPKIYNAIEKIATARAGDVLADAVVMHPRRAAWLASNLSSTFPLFQNGALNQAGGRQASGFVESFGGLKVILDGNVGVLYGASTNEDEVYVVASQDLYLAEGPLMAKVYEDIGSGSGLIRIQIYAASALLSKRYPGSISVIAGTGLTSPTWA